MNDPYPLPPKAAEPFCTSSLGCPGDVLFSLRHQRPAFCVCPTQTVIWLWEPGGPHPVLSHSFPIYGTMDLWPYLRLWLRSRRDYEGRPGREWRVHENSRCLGTSAGWFHLQTKFLLLLVTHFPKHSLLLTVSLCSICLCFLPVHSQQQ